MLERSLTTENRRMGFDLDGHLSCSKSLDLDAFAWEEVAGHPMTPDTIQSVPGLGDVKLFMAWYDKRVVGGQQGA